MSVIPTFEEQRVISLFRVLAYIGLVLLGLWLLYALRNLIPPFLVATIIAMTLIPEVDRMERRGTKRGIAIGIIYILFLSILGLILGVLVPLVSQQMSGLISGLIPSELLHGKAANTANPAAAWVDLAGGWLSRHHIPMALRPPVLNQARHAPDLLDKGVQWFSDSLPAWAANLVWVVIVPIIAFFILLDFHKILGKLLLFVHKERREGLLAVVIEIIAVFGNYVRGVLSVMGLDIVVIFLTLRLAGAVLPIRHGQSGLSEYALTLAVTAGILYTIPYFGAFVSTLLIGLVALATQGTVPALIVTGAMIIIHQVVFDNIIAPRVIGGSVNLHPLLTLFTLMAGGTLFGIGGTLLAVPIAAAIQVVLVKIFPAFGAEKAVARAEAVVKTTLAQDSEQEKPEALKEGNQASLRNDTAQARTAAAQDPPAILPQEAPQ